MSRVFNFSAGPSAMPLEVLKHAQDEFLDFNNIGASVIELSHRSKEYQAVAQQAEQDLRDLLNVPDNYKVLFLQGGGRGQFAAVPLNLMNSSHKADYIVTGAWSKYATKEAQKFGDIRRIEGTETVDGIVKLAPLPEFRADADYVYYCSNETIHGIERFETPKIEHGILINDASSEFLSKPMDVTQFGLVFAGAQKNVAPAGLTIVIVRDDLIGKASEYCPTIMDYKINADKESMYNTPPTFCWYMAGLVFKWLKNKGGLAEMEKENIIKANYLYDYLDSTDFYSNNVDPACRSRMNVPFFLKDESLNDRFLAEAKAKGLISLKGHRDLGGMRASLYNAMPLEGVKALVAFMDQFASANK
jgi:phosphoserine aminotransferase